MPTLNIVNKSPFEKRTLEQCLPRLGANDSVILIEDASVAALSGNTFTDQLESLGNSVSVYVLKPDLDARGLSDQQLTGGIELVDYAGFVDLVVSHDRVHSWL